MRFKSSGLLLVETSKLYILLVNVLIIRAHSITIIKKNCQGIFCQGIMLKIFYFPIPKINDNSLEAYI